MGLLCNIFIELVTWNPWDLCRFSEVLNIIAIIYVLDVTFSNVVIGAVHALL